MKRLGMLLFMLLLVLPVMGIQAQDSPLPFPLAVEYQDKQYVIKTLPHSVDDLPSSLTLIGDLSADQDHLYYGASWSPDGTKLVYGGKYVWDGNQSRELPVNSLQSGMPISWTQDGQMLYGMATQPDPSSAIDYVVQLYSLKLEAGAKPTLVIDKLPIQFGCGIGAELPMENRLWHEVGIANARPLWVLTPYGLVYPAECDGSESLYRPATGEHFSFANNNLIRAVLSPDGSRLAGIAYDTQGNKLVVVDLVTLAETTLTTTEPAQVVAWGKDGSLYYAAVSQSRTLVDGLSAEKSAQVKALLNTADDNEFMKANRIRVYRRAADGIESLLHEQDAYAVGALVVKDNTLVYSTIANGDAWVQAMADGKLGQQEVYSAAAYAYTSTAVNIITLKDDGSVADAITLPGDLQRVAVP